jgi:hypothetical protein
MDRIWGFEFLAPPTKVYSPEYVEGKFSEVRVFRVPSPVSDDPGVSDGASMSGMRSTSPAILRVASARALRPASISLRMGTILSVVPSLISPV